MGVSKLESALSVVWRNLLIWITSKKLSFLKKDLVFIAIPVTNLLTDNAK